MLGSAKEVSGESLSLQNGVRHRDARDLPIQVSVIMPCLNEEAAVAGCVHDARAAIARLGLSGEVVVVDNGSTDDSIRAATDAGARVISEKSLGYGNACRRGLAEAQGDLLVLGDADGTYDFSSLESFVTPLMNGTDLVVGTRLKGNIDPGAMPWLHRYVGNPVLTRALNRFLASSISDAHCGLRSIKRDRYMELPLAATGMEFASEFLITASRFGLRIGETPIVYRKRVGGEPKLRTFRDGWRHLRLMLSYGLTPAGLPELNPATPAGRSSET